MFQPKNLLYLDLSLNEKIHYCPGETIHCIANLKIAHPLEKARLSIRFTGFEKASLSKHYRGVS